MRIVNITDICEIQVGKTPSRSNPAYWGDGQLWLSIADMNQGMNLRTTKETITEKAIDETKIRIVPENTVVFSFKLSIGKVGITEVPMYTNEAIAAFLIKDHSKLDTKFLYYVLKSIDHTLGSSRAVMGKTLNKAKLQQIKIPLPSLEEQKRIVKKLDEADLLRQKRKQAIVLLDDYLKSVFLEMFGDPVANPKEWEKRNIEEVASKEKNSIKAGPFGSSLKKEFYVDSGFKIYGQEQVIRDDLTYGDYYIDEEKFTQLKNCEVKAGDLLISLVGTFGKLSVVPDTFEAGIINPRLMKISTDKEIIDPYFLKDLLQNEVMQDQIKTFSHGGTMGIVNVGIMKKIPIILPPINLQRNYLEIKSKILHVKQAMFIQFEELDTNFNALMQGAFTR